MMRKPALMKMVHSLIIYVWLVTVRQFFNKYVVLLLANGWHCYLLILLFL